MRLMHSTTQVFQLSAAHTTRIDDKHRSFERVVSDGKPRTSLTESLAGIWLNFDLDVCRVLHKECKSKLAAGTQGERTGRYGAE